QLQLTVVAQPCPGLVDQVEKGDLDSRTTRQLVATYVKPLLNRGVDTIVLGCTHYPFLKHLIEEMVGPEVAIVEPSSDVASRVLTCLDDGNMRSPRQTLGTETLWTTGTPEKVQPMFSRLW